MKISKSAKKEHKKYLSIQGMCIPDYYNWANKQSIGTTEPKKKGPNFHPKKKKKK